MAYGPALRAKIIGHVSDLENFQVNTVAGAWFPVGALVDPGKLAGNWARELAGIERPVYVVTSSGTPIAWHVAGGDNAWTVPNTMASHHRTLVAQAIKAREERLSGLIACEDDGPIPVGGQ